MLAVGELIMIITMIITILTFIRTVMAMIMMITGYSCWLHTFFIFEKVVKLLGHNNAADW